MPLLRAPDGSIVNLPAEQVSQAVAGGYAPVDVGQAAAVTTVEQPEDRGVLGTVNAAATGLLSGATLGLSDYALKGVLNRGEFKRLAYERESNPVASGVGQLAGAVIPGLASAGAAGGLLPSGALSRAVLPLVESGRALGGAAGAGRVLAAGAIEGSLQNAGAYLSDTALGDRELSAEGMIGALGGGAAFGVAGGAVALGVEQGTIAARRMFSRVAGTGNKAVAEAELTWTRQYQSTLDANDAAVDTARAQLADAKAARQQAQLAKQKAGLRVSEAGDELARNPAAGLPPVPPDAEIALMLSNRARAAGHAQILSEWDAANGQRLQEALAARGGPAELSALTSAPVAPRAAILDAAAEAELSAAVVEHDAARAELEDVFRRINAPEIEPGIAYRGPEVPAAEFGPPGARGYTPGEVKAPGPPSVVEAKTGDVTVQGKRIAAEGTPVGERNANLTRQIAEGPPEGLSFDAKNRAYRGAIEAPPPGEMNAGLAARVEPDLEFQLAAMKSNLDAGAKLGDLSAASPARADYVSNKLAKREADAAYFRAKATGLRDVPEYGALKAHEVKADAPLEQTIPAKKIAERGYYEPPGAGVDAVRVSKAKQAISEGQREAIDLTVSPSGKISVTGGRHRLAAAAEADAPIKVKWSTGAEPSEEMIRRGARIGSNTDEFFASLTAPKTRDAYVAQNIGRAMREEGSHAAALVKVEREWADLGHPLSVKKLEIAHDAALERAATATEPAERAAAQAEAQTISEHLTAVGARPGAVEDVAAIAPAVTKYEKASARVVEALGDSAPPAAREAAAAFREAEDAAERKVMDRTTRAIDDSVDSQGRPRNVVQRVKSPMSIEEWRRAHPAVMAGPIEPPAGAPAVSPVAAARGAEKQADLALKRAAVAETEAKIGARQAADRAAQYRATAEAARPVAPASSTSTLGTIATAVGVAGELGVPGLPKPHDIPVIGPLLGFYLKYRAIKAAAGRFAGRIPASGDSRAAALAAKTKDRIATAVDRTLGLAAEAAPKARGTAVAAVVVLGHRIFDDGEPNAPKDASTQEIAAVRIREISNAATRPELVIAQVRREMHGVTDPDLLHAAEQHMLARFQYLAGVVPQAPAANPYSQRPWVPSPAATSDLTQRLAVVHDPEAAFKGAVTPAAAETLRNVYPKLFEMAQQRLLERVGDLKQPVPYQQRLRNSLLFDVPLDDSVHPENAAVLQSVHAPKSTAPPTQPAPSIAGPTNLTTLYQSGLDRRSAMR